MNVLSAFSVIETIFLNVYYSLWHWIYWLLYLRTSTKYICSTMSRLSISLQVSTWPQHEHNLAYTIYNFWDWTSQEYHVVVISDTYISCKSMLKRQLCFQYLLGTNKVIIEKSHSTLVKIDSNTIFNLEDFRPF